MPFRNPQDNDNDTRGSLATAWGLANDRVIAGAPRVEIDALDMKIGRAHV